MTGLRPTLALVRLLKAYRETICPCNNDPYGNGPCEDCREEIDAARRKRAFATWESKVATLTQGVS